MGIWPGVRLVAYSLPKDSRGAVCALWRRTRASIVLYAGGESARQAGFAAVVQPAYNQNTNGRKSPNPKNSNLSDFSFIFPVV